MVITTSLDNGLLLLPMVPVVPEANHQSHP